MLDLLGKESIFWFAALLGSGLFAIQLLLVFLGGDGEDMDDFDLRFKWMSKQALTGFLMMFGWAGLTCRKEFGLPGIAAVGIGILAGLVAMIATAMIFRTAKKLRSTGTVFRIEDALGKQAQVYQRIPKSGSGKITISLDNITHELDAVSKGVELDSFTPVKVVEKVDERTVVVEPMR